ncbi:GNAT family N-acetyltransferase [bacterium]|nr:GNAT family N-acetyltransferase [bacterium]
MNIHRVSIDELADESVACLSSSSLYSSRTFLDIWRRMDGRPTVWVAEQDSEIIAALPAVEFGRGPLARLQAMPDGLPGKIIYWSDSSSLNPEAELQLFGAVRSFGYTKVYFTDFNTALTVPNEYDTMTCDTAVVDITDPNWMPPDKKLQSEIRKAERDGVLAAQFDAERDANDFIALTRATERRHGDSPRYTDDFYRALARAAAQDERMLWTVVRDGDNLAASHIYFRDGENALYWQSCLDKDRSHLKPNQALLVDAVQRLRAAGVRRLNLGQSPPEAEGLEVFKQKWGGISYRYPCYVYKSLLGKIR